MKRTQKLVTWGIVILVVLVVLLMLVSNLRRSSRVVLPDTNTSAEGGGDLPAEGGALTVVEVTPETVQAAIETLHRPEAYSRTVTVEYLWTGGSGTIELSTAVSAPWTRVDRTLPDGQVRHSITDGETTYIWYNGESEVYTGPAGAISADAEETIPTYEDVLALPQDHIVQADYRVVSDVRCIITRKRRRTHGAMPSGTGSVWTRACWWWRNVCKRARPFTGWQRWRRTRRLLRRRPSPCRTAQTCFTGKQRHPRIFRIRGCFFENSETKPAMPNAARLVLQSMEGENALQK